MYQKYHTEALVLGSYELGEADRNIVLFTKDFGLVRARASAVRTESSKMRYALQSYTHANVSLVKGKRGWRVAGATALRTAVGDPLGVATFARIAELSVRMLAGQEQNEYLFAALTEAHSALMQPAVAAYGMIEIVCVARMLYSLGYISNEAMQTAPARTAVWSGGLFTHTAYTGESLLEAETMKDKLLTSINKAIAETHL